jgi:hypothetical protein
MRFLIFFLFALLIVQSAFAIECDSLAYEAAQMGIEIKAKNVDSHGSIDKESFRNVSTSGDFKYQGIGYIYWGVYNVSVVLDHNCSLREISIGDIH